MVSTERQKEVGEGRGRLTIGSLSRATGIPVETLRTWEHRYGFPVPDRKASGHRTYPLSTVARLLRVAAALARGHRAGEVVAASEQELDLLLATSVVSPRSHPARAAPDLGSEPAGTEVTANGPRPLPATAHRGITEALALVMAFDAARLKRYLEHEWVQLGPLEFLRCRAGPLVRAVGQQWARGELEIRHEHFLSELLTDFLRAVRLPFEATASGPLVVLMTLPGETHGLGLQMSALAIAVAGCRVMSLGLEVPVPEAVAISRDLGAAALGLSISAATGGPSTVASIAELRRLLPRETGLIAGGEGAPQNPPRGVDVIQDLGSLHDWGRRLIARPQAERPGHAPW